MAFGHALYGQKLPVSPKQILKVNPLTINHYQVSYEHVVGKQTSVVVSAVRSINSIQLITNTLSKSTSEKIESKDWRTYIEYRHYFSQAPFLLYIAGFGRYRYAVEAVTASAKSSPTDHSHDRLNQKVGLGVMFGKQYRLFEDFTCELRRTG